MAIGLYIIIAGLIYLLSLTLLTPAGWRGRYSLWALPLAILGLALYVALSNLAGVRILTIGQATSYAIPGDYIAAGASAWLVMAVAVLGAVSPVGAALGLGHRA